MNTGIFVIPSAGYCVCVDKKNMIIVISLYFTPSSFPSSRLTGVSPPVAVWELNSISQSWAETRAIPHNKTRWKERRKRHVQILQWVRDGKLHFSTLTARQSQTLTKKGAMQNRHFTNLKFPLKSRQISWRVISIRHHPSHHQIG